MFMFTFKLLQGVKDWDIISSFHFHAALIVTKTHMTWLYWMMVNNVIEHGLYLHTPLTFTLSRLKQIYNLLHVYRNMAFPQ